MNVGHVRWSGVPAILAVTRLACALAAVMLPSAATTAGPPGPGLESPAAAAPVTIPAEVTKSGLVFLRALVNDSRPMWFALDSAASFPIVIDTRQAKSLGLNVGDETVAGGGAGPDAYAIARTRVPKVDLGGFELIDRHAAAISLGSLESILGRALDGVVGRELFTSHVVEIDYREQKVVLHDPKTYRYTGGGERVPLALRGNFFFIPVAIEMPGRTQLEGQFLVDTGAGLTTVLTTAFARSKNLPAPVQKMLVDRSLAGLGGETIMIVSRAASMSFGNLVIPGPIVYVSQDAAGALATSEYDGVIGGAILRRFKVIFDYARQQLILEPNAGSDEPIEYDMSGMRLHTEGDQFGTFRIHQVLEHTPAARAGLREGDELITIDGAPATRFSLDEIDDMLRRPGKKHKLGFKRSRKKFSVTIRLERLI